MQVSVKQDYEANLYFHTIIKSLDLLLQITHNKSLQAYITVKFNLHSNSCFTFFHLLLLFPLLQLMQATILLKKYTYISSYQQHSFSAQLHLTFPFVQHISD